MIKPPKNETIWVQYAKDGKVTHVITSKAIRDVYYLYEVGEGDKLIRTKYKSPNPTELEKWIYKLRGDKIG